MQQPNDDTRNDRDHETHGSAQSTSQIEAIFEQALIEKFEEEHQFQLYLKALQEITIELTNIDDLPKFYRQVIVAGRERLGFDRIALFLLDHETGLAHGTVGTSIDGMITEEWDTSFLPIKDGLMNRALENVLRFCFNDDVELRNKSEPIGIVGWNAASVLWDGKQALGWLVVDNAIRHEPASKPQLDILGLYSMAVGTLMARKFTDERLRQSESRYRLLAEHIHDVVTCMTAEGIVTYISQSCKLVLGYTPEELIGQPALIWVHPDDLPEVERHYYLAAQKAQPELRTSFRFRHGEGRYIWIEVTGQIVRSPTTGEALEIVTSARDITERKSAEEALRLSLEREKEVGLLKSRLVAMASHEFRTPLATILSASEMLSRYRSRMSEEQIEAKLARIDEQVSHLTNVVDDILSLSRSQSESDQLELVRFDWDELCRTAVATFLSRETSRSITYECETSPLWMVGDQMAIQRLVRNLLSNALKFSPEAEPVHIRLYTADDFAVMIVQDRGVGIPQQDMKHLFEPFHRGANVSMIPGTGLGLPIVKQIVDAHGGYIEVDSTTGIGTKITVALPRRG